MERTREVRRSNLASGNGLSRRRQRMISFRDSHDEDGGQMELQDTVRLRDRANKRERDREKDRERDRDRFRERELSNHKTQNKRRKGYSFSQGNNRGEDASTEESLADEEEYVIRERRVTPSSPLNFTSLSSSSLCQNTRKTLPPTKLVKQKPSVKAADVVIGVSVPRKARSGSAKRSHENWVSINGGFLEDHKASTSPTVSRSAEGNSPSPSSSNISVGKRLKPSGPKTRLPKVAKSSSSGEQDDIEIEIAEVLYGLMKQSHNPKKEVDIIGKAKEKVESKDVNCINQDNKSSASVLSRSDSPPSDLLHLGDSDSKRKKDNANDSSNPVQSISVSSVVNLESELSAKKDISTVNLEKLSCDASMSMDPREEKTRQMDFKSSNEGSGSLAGPVIEKKSITAKEESATCIKDSTWTKGTSNILESESRKEKLKIDLMAPPPMVSSPGRDCFNDPQDANLRSLVEDEGKSRTLLKKEQHEEEMGQKNVEPIGDKQKIKFDSEKSNEDNGRDAPIKLLLQSQKQQQQQATATVPKVEKTASSMPPQIAVASWPNGLPHSNGLPALGYMHPFPVVPVDGTSKAATSKQPSQFMLSQPRLKRCATHHYIARNIFLHQQFTKMNPLWPAGVKPNNLNRSTENLINGNLLQGSLPLVNLNSIHDKGQATANNLVATSKDQSSGGVNSTDPSPRKQLVLQQASQLTPAGNLPHAPALIFPFSQPQAASNQSEPSKSTTTTKSVSVLGNSSATLPIGAAAVSYNYPNFSSNEAPYLTILRNNGYSFPVTAAAGNSAAIKGVPPHAQALPFFSGSFYSSPVFHPSQLHQQQHQHNQNTSKPCVSSSSHKQPQTQQPRGTSVFGKNCLSSPNMQSQQHKQNVPSAKSELHGESTSLPVNNKGPHNQMKVYGQNFSVPMQPLSFTQIPSSEKQQQYQNKSSKGGGVELTPSQAFSMSFASFSGSSAVSNLDFSSMVQTPTIFHSLPDGARQNYHFSVAAQPAQQKIHQIPVPMKTGGGSSTQDDGKKAGSGKLPVTNAQTLVFDNSSRTLNFVSSSPITGNRPTHSISSTAISTNTPPITNSQNFQQQQFLQFQKQQNFQTQSAAGSRNKAPATNSLPSSSIGSRFPNNAHIFPPSVVQGSSSSQSSQWKNSTRGPTSQAPTTTSNTSSTLKNVTQGQISFERNSSHLPSSTQTPSSLIVGSPPSGGSILRTSSLGSKAGAALQSQQQIENSSTSTSTGQKSSPVCRRNVPSILSTCPVHLSELKY